MNSVTNVRTGDGDFRHAGGYNVINVSIIYGIRAIYGVNNVRSFHSVQVVCSVNNVTYICI